MFWLAVFIARSTVSTLIVAKERVRSMRNVSTCTLIPTGEWRVHDHRDVDSILSTNVDPTSRSSTSMLMMTTMILWLWTMCHCMISLSCSTSVLRC